MIWDGVRQDKTSSKMWKMYWKLFSYIHYKNPVRFCSSKKKFSSAKSWRNLASLGHFIKFCVISDWIFSLRSFRKVFSKGYFLVSNKKRIHNAVFFLMRSYLLCKFLFHKAYGNLVTLKPLCICQIYFGMTNGLKLLFLGNAWNVPPPQTHNQSDYRSFCQ